MDSCSRSQEAQARTPLEYGHVVFEAKYFDTILWYLTFALLPLFILPYTEPILTKQSERRVDR
jgi:hypothetical protein